MPKQISDKRVALVSLPEPPADPKNITKAEFDAGIRLECRIMDYRLSATGSDPIDQSELCTGTNASVPGRSNYEGNITVFRYYTTDDGTPDAVNDVAWDAFKEKGTVLHLVEREGPEYDADATEGEEISYYEVISDDPQKPTERAGFIRREIPLFVQRAVENTAIASGA